MLYKMDIHNFRNIHSLSVNMSPRFNLICGQNGAGKTSLLEAIYYLGTGKSFRTHLNDRIIRHDAEQLLLFARCHHSQFETTIGIQRDRTGSQKIHFNQEPIKSISVISAQLPIQVIDAESHRLLTDGPKVRRQFLDWGLFYTNPQFHAYWKEFQKILVQRNAALKARAPQEEISAWNTLFSNAATTIHTMREQYLLSFLPFLNDVLRIFLDQQIACHYSSGWHADYSLLEALHHDFSKDMALGHTHSGPHRADLVLTVDNHSIADALSQGQLKLVAYALRLAQGLHFLSKTNLIPIFLIDDLPSELDRDKQALVLKLLSSIHAQTFITGIFENDLKPILALDSGNKMFHVEHGKILEECFT